MKEPKDWKYNSPDSPGFHPVITPENSICKVIRIFRINLLSGQSYNLSEPGLELNGVVIEGRAEIDLNGLVIPLDSYDSFYLPAGRKLFIKALSETIIYIGGAPYEGRGEFFTRKFNPGISDSKIRQVHGAIPYRRDVFMTLADSDSASRLICGITTGDPGGWTSWPPHQHSKDLEEVYCYFGIPKPHFALHLSSRISGTVEFVHPVHNGSCVIIPEGYHPTVAMPGVKSCYFWVMAAHSSESRRYDLSVNDPEFI